MMYIGTSLGGCLRSILANEVSLDEVVFIVTRTNAPTYDRYIKVVNEYHTHGNPFARKSYIYELNEYPWEAIKAIADELWYSGRIHQPRTFMESGSVGYNHPMQYGQDLWLEIAPVNHSTNPAVVEAYEKYRMLNTLTK